MSSNNKHQFDDPHQWVVLVVDDEKDNIDIAVQLLKHVGATVLTARNGQEGLQIFQANRPTVILADLSMPIKDGWDMLKEIRALSGDQHVPVVAVTAHAMKGTEQDVMQAGFDGYISKPFRVSTLVDNIRNILLNHQ